MLALTLDVLLAGSIGALTVFMLGVIWDYWRHQRENQREMRSLLRLVQAETNDSIRMAELLLRKPEFITGLPDVLKDDAFKDDVWKETRVRLAKLLPDENHFDIINAFYSNTAVLRQSIKSTARENGEGDNPATRATHSALVESLMEDLEETRGWGRDVQSIILSYITPNRVVQQRSFEQIEQEAEQLLKREARREAKKEIERMEREEN